MQDHCVKLDTTKLLGFRLLEQTTVDTSEAWEQRISAKVGLSKENGQPPPQQINN